MNTNGPALDPAVLDSLRELNQEGEPDVVVEVLTLFLQDASTRLKAIVAAVEAEDATALLRGAHVLKGASGSVGAMKLHEVCRRLEQLGRDGSLAEAAPVLAALHAQFARVEAEMRKVLELAR